VVALPLAYKGIKQNAGVIGWLLVAIAVTPPALVMLHPGVNRASDVFLHHGIRIATPEVRMFGRVVVRSKTIWELEPRLKPSAHQHPFEPLAVEAPYFLDESPPGSYDFTLIDPVTDSDVVTVPSPCAGDVIDSGYSAGYGYYLEVNCIEGHQFFMAHFSELHVENGAQVIKGAPLAIQGSTGNSTGPHVHAEITPASGNQTNREETLPIMEAAIAFWKAGIKPAPPPEPLTLGESPLSDKELKAAIGNAEGTANIDGTPNHNYWGHVDPGNGAANLGFFSYQHGAATAEEADQKQLQRLRNAEREIQAQAAGKFGQPLSEAALLTALDLWNQAPLAGQDFVKHLPTHDPSPEQIVEARSLSFIEPATGALDAPGLGNTWHGVKVDQRRRTDEVLSTLDYLRRGNRDK
jgi:hypothetical protein